jgi:hypothetical protein
MERNESLTVSIARAIATAEGTDPEALRPPLGRVIDPDALETIQRRSTANCRVEFSYRDHEVVVEDGGDEVSVDGIRYELTA